MNSRHRTNTDGSSGSYVGANTLPAPRPEELQYVTKQRKLIDLITQVREIGETLLESRFWGENDDRYDFLQYPLNNIAGQEFVADKLQVLSCNNDYKVGFKNLMTVPNTTNSVRSNAMSFPSSPNKSKACLVSCLLREKLEEACKHLGRLIQRITDNRSKVLVTGDLNSGKSTLVNSILKHNVLPCDQQPCTQIFAEVIDSAYNNNVEELHCIYPKTKYSSGDQATYVRRDMKELQKILEENKEGYERLKLYYDGSSCSSGGILKNELIEIILIDSPGLNIDTTKTTSLFAKQEEIDAIVFVVNAENHFTLSGREFLETAGKEKAYIFIVVNKFDNIKDKERCKSMIIKQIEKISPLTHKELESLVHFVSAKCRLSHILSGDLVMNDMNKIDQEELMIYQNDFIHLEECLSSFILEKRAVSKLAPAKIYLENLIMDLKYILEYNIGKLENALVEHQTTVNQYLPEYQKMSTFFDNLQVLENVVEEACSEIECSINESLNQLLDNFESFMNLVEWKSLYNYKDFGRALCSVLKDTANYVLQDSFDEILPKIEMHTKCIDRECLKLIEKHTNNDTTTGLQLFNKVNSLYQKNTSNALAPIKRPSLTPNNSLSGVEQIALSELKNNFKIQEFIKEYSPSIGATLLGSLGSRYYLVRKTNKLPLNNYQSKDATNILILALITSGMGVLMYRLSNMKNKVRKKVIDCLKDYTEKSMFVRDNYAIISSYARSFLCAQLGALRTTLSEIICESENKISYSKNSIAGLERILGSMRNTLADCSRVERGIRNLSL